MQATRDQARSGRWGAAEAREANRLSQESLLIEAQSHQNSFDPVFEVTRVSCPDDVHVVFHVRLISGHGEYFVKAALVARVTLFTGGEQCIIVEYDDQFEMRSGADLLLKLVMPPGADGVSALLTLYSQWRGGMWQRWTSEASWPASADERRSLRGSYGS